MKVPIKIVALSDTHGHHRSVKVLDGDVLVYSGDFMTSGRMFSDDNKCYSCNGTGWIVSYGPGKACRYPCSCQIGGAVTDKLQQLVNSEIVTYTPVEPTTPLVLLPEVKGRRFRDAE